MGKVTEYLLNLIKKQVDDKRIVVWYDPDKVYSKLIRNLHVSETPVLRFEDSFFRLREQIDPYLEFIDVDAKPRHDCEIAPKLIVYVPVDRRDSDNALVEVEAAGVVMEPGAHPWQRNTRMRVLAEHVFKKIAPDRVEEITRQVDEGLLSLEELDQVSIEADSIGTATIKLIFGTTALSDTTLMFAASSKHDEAIETKKAMGELSGFFRKELGISVAEEGNPEVARKSLCSGLLMTDFLLGMPEGERPDAFSSLEIPTDAKHVKAIKQICEVWRNRLDLRDAYVETAKTVEVEMGLAGVEISAEGLTDLHTFSALEKQLLQAAEKSLLTGNPQEALSLAIARKISFWSSQEPPLQLHWSLLENSARILILGDVIRSELKKAKKDPRQIVQFYAEAEEPWSLLDTYYRHLEHQYSTFDLELTGEHEGLQNLMTRVRQEYTQTTEPCVETFAEALEVTDFEIDGFLPQSNIYAQHVLQYLEKNEKTAYILVDALRYEMGRELIEGLTEEFEASIVPAIAQLPTITSLGMAALMPGAEDGMELVEIAGGKLSVSLGNTKLKDRSARLKYFEEKAEVPITVCKLNELIKPSKKRQAAIKESTLVITTSQELDRWGEEADAEDEVRVYMNEVLDKLRKGIRRLAALGVTQFVITADHGHLFGESIEGGMKMDAPGGDTKELHSRAWIGKGGKAAEGFLRVPASQLGLGGDFELAFPRSLACFKTKGGTRAYCHGGISLQEMVIPVILLTTKTKLSMKRTAAVQLVAAKPKITTRFFSVTATYTVEGLFGAEELRVKVEVRAKKKELGLTAMAAYGFEEGTREIVLQKDKPNPITLMLTDTEGVTSASIHVLDAASQIELARLENVPVEISI